MHDMDWGGRTGFIGGIGLSVAISLKCRGVTGGERREYIGRLFSISLELRLNDMKLFLNLARSSPLLLSCRNLQGA
jgi:hypothetical protein